MPLYDYIYGTMDKSTDELYETSLKREAESSLDVVHLTHLITPESIYHLRLGFASLALRPFTLKWYLWLIWPVTLWSMMVTWLYGRTFVVERHRYSKLRLQTWAIPKYSIQVKKDFFHFFASSFGFRRIRTRISCGLNFFLYVVGVVLFAKA